MRYVYTVYGSEDGIFSVYSNYLAAEKAAIAYCQDDYAEVEVEVNRCKSLTYVTGRGISAIVEKFVLNF